MSDNKTPQQPASPAPLNESHDFGEAMLKSQVNDSVTATVSMRVPMPPAPTRPPDRNKNE